MIETTYRIIPADRHLSVTEISVIWPGDPGYEAIRGVCQPVVDPRNPGNPSLERVRVLHNDDVVDMVVHENGIAMGMPINQRATAIYRGAALRRNPDMNISDLPSIYGNAVLFLRQVWF